MEEARKAPAIPLTGCVSTRIAAIGYDPSAETLALQFVGNPERVYHYHGVPAEVASAMENAQSKGSFFYNNINQRFPFDRIEADGTISKTWAPEAPPKSAEPSSTEPQASAA